MGVGGHLYIVDEGRIFFFVKFFVDVGVGHHLYSHLHYSTSCGKTFAYVLLNICIIKHMCINSVY